MTLVPDAPAPRVFDKQCTQLFDPWRTPSLESGSLRADLRPGRRAVLLSVSNGLGSAVAFAFTPVRGGVNLWRTLSPQRERFRHVRRLSGPFTPLALARHLASGAVDPVVAADVTGDVEVDGVDELGAALLRLAWSRRDGKVDPRVAVVLRLGQAAFDATTDRVGCTNEDDLLELGDHLLKYDAEWLGRWAAAIDAAVDRRAALESAGEARRRELHAFVEECLLVLGRMPRPEESPSSWDGAGLREDRPGPRRLRRLGLTGSGRVRRYGIRLQFFTAADTCGSGECGPEPGWYFWVTNPNPLWILSTASGPYMTPEEAWSDAAYIGEGEE